MKTEYLCTEYWQWLQMNPAKARIHRHQQDETARQLARAGCTEKALVASGEAFEIAQAIMLSLHQHDTDMLETKQDMVAFVTLASGLAKKLALVNTHFKAAKSLKVAREQLRVLAPLFACHFDILMLMRQLEMSLNEGEAYYERQTFSQRELH
ncbi:hypothetical protein [Alteromonas sp. C1M14]|uniref:hypothetical protein n=1 Tax=Alteromonas sp. C1M14 TaxID=2841567 RepID=UPI001C08CB3B|nr:hypothetical protein [Alteromonas sp. C1M14]MBU2978404.1 hypothetical protein [Alteromonas sp. C1M14]